MPVDLSRRQLAYRDLSVPSLARSWCSRSSLSPISQLPVELLEFVFLHWRAIDQPNADLLHYGWISVLFVCRSWMTVAKRCPTLWAIIPGVNLTPNWVLKMLMLSKNAPLTLSLDYTKRSTLSPRHIFTSANLLRLRSLDLTLSDYDTEGAIALCSAPAADELYSLTVSVSRITLMLPATVFSSFLPKLEVLVLRNCAIPWDSTGVFQRLVYLSVHHCAELESALVGSEKLAVFHNAVDALYRMSPTLRSLSLRNYIPAIPPTQGCRSHNLPILLPVLENLTLEGQASHIASFMSILSYPDSTSVSMFLDCSDPVALLETARQPDSTHLQPRMLEIDFDSAERVEIALRLHFPLSNTSRSHTRTFYINPLAQGQRWSRFCGYTDFVRALHFGKTHTIIHRASPIRCWSSLEWRTLFAHGIAPNIRKIVATNEPAAIGLLDALAPEDVHVGDDVFAPRLQYLQIAPIHARYIRSARLAEPLVTKLEDARIQAGCPISAIVITRVYERSTN